MSTIKTCFILLILWCLMVLNWMSFLISLFIQRREWHLPLLQRCSPIEPFSFLVFPYFDFPQDKRCLLIQLNVDEKMCLSSRIYRIKKNQHSLSKGPMYLPLFSPSSPPNHGGVGACSRQPLACPLPGGGPKAWQPPIITPQQQRVQLPSADWELLGQNP